MWFEILFIVIISQPHCYIFMGTMGTHCKGLYAGHLRHGMNVQNRVTLKDEL